MHLFTKFLLLASVCTVASVVHIQLSSDQNQECSEGEITFNQVDSVQGVGFSPGDSKITIAEAGFYFVVAGPQARALKEKKGKNFEITTWFSVNGVDVPNSNVLYKDFKDTKDVIITQGVLHLEVGDYFELRMAGDCVVEAITLPGQPLVPSVIFTMFKL